MAQPAYADAQQCEAQIKPAHSPMSFGPPPRYVRCTNAPKYILTDEPNEGLSIMEMSLCDECLAAFKDEGGVATHIRTLEEWREVNLGLHTKLQHSDLLKLLEDSDNAIYYLKAAFADDGPDRRTIATKAVAAVAEAWGSDPSIFEKFLA